MIALGVDMHRDQIVGWGLFGGSLAIAIIYVWLLFFPPPIKVFGMSLDVFVLKLTGAIAVCAVGGIVAWIGYTLATTPPPKPIEEIEKELEEELKKLEEELKKEESKREEQKAEEGSQTGSQQSS